MSAACYRRLEAGVDLKTRGWMPRDHRRLEAGVDLKTRGWMPRGGTPK